MGRIVFSIKFWYCLYDGIKNLTKLLEQFVTKAENHQKVDEKGHQKVRHFGGNVDFSQLFRDISGKNRNFENL